MKKEKTVFILGASSGVGRALAQHLYERYSLILGARRAVELKEAFPQARVFFIDVCQEQTLRLAYQQMEQEDIFPDIVINSAGIGIFKTISEMTTSELRLMLEVNVIGTFISCQEAFFRMKKKQSGTLINLSSIAGKIAFGGGSGYNASKFALSGFSEAFMMEAREFGIKVLTLFPGSIDTPFHQHTKRLPQKDQMLQAQEVAEFIAQLIELPENFLCDQIQFRPLRKKGVK